MEIIIRRATLEDVPAVAKLHVDNWNETYKGIIAQEHLDNMRNNIDARIERMKNQFNDRIMLVATINNEIVAFSEYTETNKYSQDLEADCELCGLYVKNEYKGQGIGSKLFNYIQDEFRKNSSKTMCLWCVKENEPSIRFYEKMGGKQVAEKKFTLAGKEYSEVAFIYDLLELKRTI